MVKGDGGARDAGASEWRGRRSRDLGARGHGPDTSLPFALWMAAEVGRCMLRFESVGRCKLTVELAERRLSEAIAVTRTRCGSCGMGRALVVSGSVIQAAWDVRSWDGALPRRGS